MNKNDPLQSQEAKKTYVFSPQNRQSKILIAAITVIALAVLTAGVSGQIVTNAGHAFSSISPLANGIMIGSSGMILSGMALYALICFLNKNPKVAVPKGEEPPPIELKPLPTSVQPPAPVEPPLEPLSIETPRISLLYAMTLYKNYDDALAARYANNQTLSTFLQDIAQAYPDGTANKEKIQELYKLQKALENCESESLVKNYEQWLSSGAEPFMFFNYTQNTGFSVVEWKKDAAPSLEEFKKQVTDLKGVGLPTLPNPNPKKTPWIGALHDYLKTDDTDKFFMSKRIYKIKLLRKILNDYPEWRNDLGFRAWVKSSVLYLRNKIEKLDVKKGDTFLKDEREKARIYLQTLEHELSMLPEAERPTPKATEFSPLHIEHVKYSASVAYPGVKKEQSAAPDLQNEKKTLPSAYPQFKTKEDIALLQQWHVALIDSYKTNGKQIVLEREAFQFLLHLPDAKTLPVFLNTLTEEEKEKVEHQIYEIANLALTQHVLSGKLAMHPARFLALIKALDFQTVVVQSIDKAAFDTYTPETNHFRLALMDSYFDLGPYQQAIRQAIFDLESRGVAVDLVQLNRDNAEELIEGWDRSKRDQYKVNTVPFKDDFEGKLTPISIIRLRKLQILMEAFISPHELLKMEKKSCWGREDAKKYLESLQDALNDKSRDMPITGSLLDVTIKGKRSDPRSTMDFVIGPLGVTFQAPGYRFGSSEFEKTLGPPLSPHYKAFKNRDIRERVAAGMVCGVTQDYVDQDGHFGAVIKHSTDEVGHNVRPDGLKQTQLRIHEEKMILPSTSLEVSRALQKMASGQDNRASNALYAFGLYPHLLMHEQYGNDYKQVFRLLIFRSNLLVRELISNPSGAQAVLTNFDTILTTCEKAGDFETWAFVYKAHVDTLANMDAASIDTTERKEKHTQYTKQLIDWMQAPENAENPLPAKSRSALQLAHLYHTAVAGFDPTKLMETAKDFLRLGSQIEQLLTSASLEGQIIYDFAREITPRLIEKIENEGSDVLNQLFTHRLKGQKLNWQKIQEGVYRADDLTVDISTFRIIQANEQEGMLPREIRENKSFMALFGKEILHKIYTFSLVSTPFGKAWHVPIEKDEVNYSFYFRENDPNFPLLFRQKEKCWQQLVRLNDPSPLLPVDFKNGFMWASNSGFSVEDPKGKQLYTPYFEKDRLTRLERHVNGHREIVLDSTGCGFFAKLDDPDGFVVTESKTKKPMITYLRGNAQYVWNAEENKWESLNYKGYFLSSKRIEEWVPQGSRAKAKGHFFAQNFENYHLLVNKEGHGKLVIPHRSLQRAPLSKNVLASEIKYSRALIANSNTSSPWEHVTFAAFDLEPNGYVKTKQPEDFLYLAYLLFVQEKYGDALLYLTHSQAVWTAADTKIRQFRSLVKQWFLDWNDPSPNACAVRVKMLKMEHEMREATFPSTDAVMHLDAEFLPVLHKQLEMYEKVKDKIDPALRLNAHEEQDLKFLLERANNNNTDKLQKILDEQIAALEKSVRSSQSAPTSVKDTPPPPIFDVSPWLVPISESEKHKATQVKVDAFVTELQEVFKGDTLADAMGLELAEDIACYAKKVASEMTVKDVAALASLLIKLDEYETQFMKDEQYLRSCIVHMFSHITLTQNQTIEICLRDQEAKLHHLFEKARHCFGINDFSSLVDMQAIPQDRVDSLKNLVLKYEIARTNAQLMARKKLSIKKLTQNPENSILRDECASVLQEWRQYDPENHPYASLLLLLEDERNVCARKSQIKHIHKLISHPDAYIHEAMAGGKTTFLRNLFAAIESQKGRLAGVMTYSPLMAMHHKEFADINNRAFGSAAYPFTYNRNADHDVTAFKLMTIYHLKALSRGGRIDQTPQAAISLNHTLTELVYGLQTTDQKGLKEQTPVVNALQKLLQVRQDHLSVYSDEVDKIFDPMKDFNYSVGSGVVLDKSYYAPALTLVKFMMEKKEFGEILKALQKNPLYLQQLDDSSFEDLLRSLAKAVYDHIKPPFDEKTTLDYLTEMHQTKPSDDPTKTSDEQKKMVEFYENVVLKHPDTDLVLQMQLFHSLIGVLFRNMKNKIVGTDFGRSADGVSVKPFRFSAVCQESSQRSFVLATVLEACFDYMISGVSDEGVKAYIDAVKLRATQELVEAENLDATDAGKKFHARFGMLLTKVKKSDYAKIAQGINNSYSLLEDCLTEILFTKFVYYNQKIEGNAHHLPHLVGHFSGSSGSPERVKTLPNTISKHAKLIRQKGAIGSVFYALLKDFDEKQDMVAFVSGTEPGAQIAPLLKPGDTFIDNAPFFSGKRGLEIVQSIAKNASALTTYRYLDEDDDVCIWDSSHSRKGESGVNLDEVVSVISHKGRQGTNWTFAKGTKGIVEAGITTELTSFYQSIMRLRLLGKGQKASVIYDTNLNQQWNQVPALAGKSLLTRCIYTFVMNENNLVRRLNFQANRKQITSLRTQAIDAIKGAVKDTKALAYIKELPDFKLVQPALLDPKKCGAPVVHDKAERVLQKVQKEEVKLLKSLNTNIQTLPISEDIKTTCSDLIEAQLKCLEDPGLILDARYLPQAVPSNHENYDAVEEIETEINTEQEAVQEVEQEVSLEVEMELNIETEMSLETERDEVREHPMVREGREWIDYGMSSWWWSDVFNNHKDSYNALVDSSYFPLIQVTNYALGLYQGQVDAKTPQGEKIRSQQMWCYHEVEKESSISSKAMVAIHKDELAFQLMSIKDADFYMYESLQKRRVVEEWAQVAGKGKEAIAEFRRKVYESNMDNRRYKTEKEFLDHMAYCEKNFKDYQLFKVDLRQTSVPKEIPASLRDKWIEKMALSKFLYIEAKFSQEELAFLSGWLEKFPVPLETLEKRLKHYLARFCPSTDTHPLLSLIQQKIRAFKGHKSI